MHQNVLIENGERFGGQYVAIKSFSNHEVISHGIEPEDVLQEAHEKGFGDPVLIYVPEKDTVHIY